MEYRIERLKMNGSIADLPNQTTNNTIHARASMARNQ